MEGFQSKIGALHLDITQEKVIIQLTNSGGRVQKSELSILILRKKKLKNARLWIAFER